METIFCADIISGLNFYHSLQDSLLRYGKEALSHKNGTKQREALKKLGQASLMVGVFAVAAFAVKQMFS